MDVLDEEPVAGQVDIARVLDEETKAKLRGDTI